MLEQAYAHWLVQEEPYPVKDGIVPTSPRGKLVEALNKIRPASYPEIKGFLADTRSDVREIGIVALKERLRQPGGERLRFFSDVERGDVSGHVLGSVLKDRVPLGPAELATAEALLGSEHASVRYSAMELLVEQYLDRERILGHATMLTRDSEQQIKDRAFAILDRR